ncbi:MAG: cytochrome C [Thermomicrobiales bacterium]
MVTADRSPAMPATARQEVGQRAMPDIVGRVRQYPLRFAGLVIAAILLIASIALPYWSITLHAPQYPAGLTVDAYTYKLTGDVSEVDGLNHYIGMMKLGDAAKIERGISRVAIPVIALLAIASFWVRGRGRWLLVAPVIIYPIVFTVDLFIWLYYAGHSLDPNAALSSSIKEFTPRIFGTGVIGQFSTEAAFGVGFYLVLLAVALVIAATYRKRAEDATAR